MNNKYLNLFKVFFPSWEFFDEIEDNFVLKYRYSTSNIELSEWHVYNEKINRKFSHLIFNPKGNLLLNIDSNLQLLANSINQLLDSQKDSINRTIDITQNYHYQIISNYLSNYLSYFIFNNINTKQKTDFSIKNIEKSYTYQFKLCNQIISKNIIIDDDLFISAIHFMD